MPVVATAPDAVDKSLIIGVERRGVLAGVKVVGNVHVHIVVPEIKRRGRALRNETAVDVELEIVVGGEPDDNAPAFIIEPGAEQDVQVLLHRPARGGFFKLPVPQRDRRVAGQVRVGDGFAFKNSHDVPPKTDGIGRVDRRGYALLYPVSPGMSSGQPRGNGRRIARNPLPGGRLPVWQGAFAVIPIRCASPPPVRGWRQTAGKARLFSSVPHACPPRRCGRPPPQGSGRRFGWWTAGAQ